MTRLLLFADLHLDSAFAWMAGDQDASRGRRQALRVTLHRIVDRAVELKVDALLCGGDLYEHDRFTPTTAAFLKSGSSGSSLSASTSPLETMTGTALGASIAVLSGATTSMCSARVACGLSRSMTG